MPVFGTILLNPSRTKVVLIKSFGYWGLPKGKVNKGETEFECSLRETLEEVGFDATPLADPKLFIDSSTAKRNAKFYVVFDVPEKTPFQTNSHQEIQVKKKKKNLKIHSQIKIKKKN